MNVHTICVGPENTTNRVLTLLSYLRLLLACRGQLLRLRPDVVHAHYTITHGVIAGVADVHPLALSAWGTDVMGLPSGKTPAPLRWLNRFAMKKADALFSTSRFMAERCAQYASPGRTIHHVPFGIDPERFVPDHSPAARHGFRVGFVKTLQPAYAPGVLLEAMATVIAALPDARLVMAGRGSLRESLEQRAKELGIADRVEFMGFVEHDDVPALMASFDVLVNCSICQETFGVVILEAQACEVPAVVSRVGGVGEACVEGETALMVPPGDPSALAEALLALARDTERRRAMGRRGRQFVVDNYVWSDNVDQMMAHLERLAESAEDTVPPVAAGEGA